LRFAAAPSSRSAAAAAWLDAPLPTGRIAAKLEHSHIRGIRVVEPLRFNSLNIVSFDTHDAFVNPDVENASYWCACIKMKPSRSKRSAPSWSPRLPPTFLMLQCLCSEHRQHHSDGDNDHHHHEETSVRHRFHAAESYAMYLVSPEGNFLQMTLPLT